MVERQDLCSCGYSSVVEQLIADPKVLVSNLGAPPQAPSCNGPYADFKAPPAIPLHKIESFIRVIGLCLYDETSVHEHTPHAEKCLMVPRYFERVTDLNQLV